MDRVNDFKCFKCGETMRCDCAAEVSESIGTAGYIDVAFDKFIEFPDSKNREFVTATSAKLFAEFWAELRKPDTTISSVCDFVGAYEKENKILREAIEFIASQGDLKGNWAVERARLALRECRGI